MLKFTQVTLFYISLLLSQVGMPLAFAQEEAEKMAPDKDGPLAAEDLTNNISTKETKDNEMVAIILGTIVSSLSTVFALPVQVKCTSPTVQPSAVAFSAAALAHIVGGIVLSHAYESKIAQYISDERIKKEFKTKAQAEILREASKATMDAHDAVQRKVILHSILTGIYTIAAILGYVEFIRKVNPYDTWEDSCQNEQDSSSLILQTVNMVLSLGASLGTTGLNAPSDAPDMSTPPATPSTTDPSSFWHSDDLDFPQTLKKAITLLRNELKEAKSLAQSFALYLEGARVASGKKSSLSLNQYQAIVQSMESFGLQETQKKAMQNTLSQQMSDFFIPQAYAMDFDTPQGAAMITQMSVTLLTTLIPPLNSAIVSAMSSGLPRGIVFTVFAGFSGGATGELEGVRQTFKKRAKVYSELADKLSDKGYDPASFDPDQILNNLPDIGFAPPGTASLEEMYDVNDFSFPCVTGSGQTMQADKDCACKKTNSCSSAPSLSLPKGFSNLGPISTDLMATQEGINAMNSGDFTKMAAAAKGMAKNAATYANIASDLEKKINTTLKSQGKPTIDFKKKKEELKDLLGNKTKVALAKLSPSERQKLEASLLGGITPPQSKEQKALSSQNKGSAQYGKASKSSPAANKKKGVDLSALFGNDTNYKFKEEDKSAAQKNDNAFKDKKLNQNDISKKRETSIFKMLSIRYMRSAFPVFFKEKTEKGP